MRSPRRNRKDNAAQDAALRRQLVELLAGSDAHADIYAALGHWPRNLRGISPPGAPHTAWQLLEHLRIAQWDILEYIRNPKHVSPDWPEGYWPPNAAPPSARAWEGSFRRLAVDLKAMQELLADPRTDLMAKIPGGHSHTILREALLLADHNAYHVGQLVLLRRLLGAWKTPA